jgi:hypothetical protein
MTIDRSRIGFATAPTRVPIDAWRVKLFCQAIGETDAVHWDVAGRPRCRPCGLPGAAHLSEGHRRRALQQCRADAAAAGFH